MTTKVPDANILNAIAQLRESFTPAPGIVAGFELAEALPQAFKGAADELREIRADAQAALEEFPAEVLAEIPGSVKAALLNSTSPSELAARKGTLAQYAEAITAGNESRLHALHADHMTKEEKLAHFFDTIQPIKEEIAKDMDELYKLGGVSKEHYEEWKRREAEIAKMADGIEKIRAEIAHAQWLKQKMEEEQKNNPSQDPKINEIRIGIATKSQGIEVYANKVSDSLAFMDDGPEQTASHATTISNEEVGGLNAPLHGSVQDKKNGVFSVVS